MLIKHRPKKVAGGIALLALLVIVDEPSSGPSITMDSLWPNDDGRSWSYDQHYESFGPVPEVVDNQIRLVLDGSTVAPDAINAQYLRQQLVSGPALRSKLAGVPADPFLRQLWIARPDLRGRIQLALSESPCPQNAPSGSYSVLLSGEFAFLKTANEVAAWRCNLPNTRSWQWLVSNLTIGNSFTLQLIPDLASDVYLHGTIAAIESATVPAGTFASCVRVDYVIDYGTSACVDSAGNVFGTFRSETRGAIHYAPGVGPIQSHEEFIPYAQVNGSCVDPGEVGNVASATSLQLNSQPVPVRRTSWARVKQSYR